MKFKQLKLKNINIIMNEYEQYLLSNSSELSFMNNLLKYHQFSEEFLIKTRPFYDSWKCMKTQNGLSIEFCFKYLYDSEFDSADDWTDYYEIENYFLKKGYTKEQIRDVFEKIEL